MEREEQLKLARQLLESGVLSEESAKAIKADFPELAESEDERIRNLIYCLIRDRGGIQKLLELNGVSVDDALAYLEKQKESLHISETCKENADSFTCGQPAGWNELDEIIEKAICVLEANFEPNEEFSGLDITRCQLVERLKSLPERFNRQSKQEWSEEDETRFINIIIMLKEYMIHHYSKDDVNKSVNWLENRVKFLRPQPHWKPTTEQMNALLNLMRYGVYLSSWGKLEGQIESLYGDLTKL